VIRLAILSRKKNPAQLRRKLALRSSTPISFPFTLAFQSASIRLQQHCNRRIVPISLLPTLEVCQGCIAKHKQWHRVG
jgi:hypothetical protein